MLGSIYQGNPFWAPIFDPQPYPRQSLAERALFTPKPSSGLPRVSDPENCLVLTPYGWAKSLRNPRTEAMGGHCLFVIYTELIGVSERWREIHSMGATTSRNSVGQLAQKALGAKKKNTSKGNWGASPCKTEELSWSYYCGWLRNPSISHCSESLESLPL